MGTPAVGNKGEMIEKLMERYQSVTSNKVKSILSLKIGLQHVTYTKIDKDFEILEWDRIPCDITTPYSTIDFALKTTSLIDKLPKADLYLIDRKYHRSESLVVETVFKACVIESQLHSLLIGKSQSIPHKSVNDFFHLYDDKMKSINLTKLILQNNVLHLHSNQVCDANPVQIPVTISKSLKKYFENDSMKEDLSQSLLQGLAYYSWILNAKKRIQMLKKESEGCQLCSNSKDIEIIGKQKIDKITTKRTKKSKTENLVDTNEETQIEVKPNSKKLIEKEVTKGEKLVKKLVETLAAKEEQKSEQNYKEEQNKEEEQEIVPKRKRGRPKKGTGSKNKLANLFQSIKEEEEMKKEKEKIK